MQPPRGIKGRARSSRRPPASSVAGSVHRGSRLFLTQPPAAVSVSPSSPSCLRSSAQSRWSSWPLCHGRSSRRPVRVSGSFQRRIASSPRPEAIRLVPRDTAPVWSRRPAAFQPTSLLNPPTRTRRMGSARPNWFRLPSRESSSKPEPYRLRADGDLAHRSAARRRPEHAAHPTRRSGAVLPRPLAQFHLALNPD